MCSKRCKPCSTTTSTGCSVLSPKIGAGSQTQHHVWRVCFSPGWCVLDSDSHAGFINVPIPKRVVNPDMLDDDAVGQKHVNEVVEEAMDNVCLLLFTHRALAMRFLHHHGEPLKPTQVPNATGTALVGAKVGGQPRVGFVRARCLTRRAHQ